MKTKIGMFCVGACLLAACTGQERWQKGDEVIRLGASTLMHTRTGEGLQYLSTLGNKVGIYGVVTSNTDAGTLPWTDWTDTPLMANVRTTAIDATNGNISWEEVYNYPLETNSRVKFCAYYPYAKVGKTGDNYVSVAPGRAPILNFTITGKEDVMVADPVLGSRVKPASALNFNHVLTQFKFQMVNADESFGRQIKSISIKRANTKATLDLQTGELAQWTTPKEEIEVVSFDTPIAVTGTAEAPQLVGKELMLQPKLNQFTVGLTYENGYQSELTIQPKKDEVFEAGKSYLITLKFYGKTEIAVGASIVPWGITFEGEETIE